MSARRSEFSLLDMRCMARALELAARGQGHVEPNPMVGCVVVQHDSVVGEGWHRRFGGPHAEIEALREAGQRAAGGTLYVTLEPCCHHGKTPPCTRAVIDAGIHRAVIAIADPFPHVAGRGIGQLEAAGIDVQTGLRDTETRQLCAPYLKRIDTGRPWVLAKWAMTLDGKIATSAGESRWISGAAARCVVQSLRGRVDAILIGRRTAAADDPLLIARPPGPRVATRIVVDSSARLALTSQLMRTVGEAPVLVAAQASAPDERCRRLEQAGAEVYRCPGESATERLGALLDELGRRQMTNVLVEGGGSLLGSLFDRNWIDEVHVFVAPKLLGGSRAPTPLAGAGIANLAEACAVERTEMRRLGEDVYFSGRVRRGAVQNRTGHRSEEPA
jgi:diaminohydroxyphosphoribosylaminopyrimidine deaminase/5-amino-6-(5-phosphoribosylamino)uracil reductase